MTTVKLAPCAEADQVHLDSLLLMGLIGKETGQRNQYQKYEAKYEAMKQHPGFRSR